MVPLVAGKGISLLHPLASCCRRRRKKRGWTTQHRPTSNRSKDLPDSPGSAARKPAGNAASVSVTHMLLPPVDSSLEWLRETIFQVLTSFLGTRKARFQQGSASAKTVD